MEIWAAIEDIRKERISLQEMIQELQKDLAERRADKEGTPLSRGKLLVLDARFSFDRRDDAYAWLLKPNAKLGGLEPLTAAMQSAAGRERAMAVLKKNWERRQDRTANQELDMLLKRLEEERG